MTEKKENPGYYAVIPAKVRYDKSLCPNAKLLYAEITALADKEGYCWASNKYFADLYDVNRSSITHWIKQLLESGYIRQELIYGQGKPNIQERRIFISMQVFIPKKKQDEPPSIEVSDGGGELNHQGGGEIFNQGGEKTQERILNSINKSSSSSDPPEPEKTKEEAEDQFSEKPKEGAFNGPCVAANTADPGEITPEEILNLKQRLKQLNPGFIFDESFYRRAVNFMSVNQLDFEYTSWMYNFCDQKKPRDIVGYYFKVFFEHRCVEIYKKSSRPPPIELIKCPVCGIEHDKTIQACPGCGLESSLLHFPDQVKYEKSLYNMPPAVKAEYDHERSDLLNDETVSFEEKIIKLRIIDQKYGLTGHG